jgi:hypothetical protein
MLLLIKTVYRINKSNQLNSEKMFNKHCTLKLAQVMGLKIPKQLNTTATIVAKYKFPSIVHKFFKKGITYSKLRIQERHIEDART